MAEKHRGLVVFAEHRYFGESLPFGSSSFQEGKIGYLTVEQALADYAELILHLKKVYNAESNYWLALGGSYGGMLSAWFRIQYPHVVDGALAGSAPILETNYQANPPYFTTVTNDFARIDKR